MQELEILHDPIMSVKSSFKFGHNHTIRTLHWILVLSVETWSDTRAVYRYFPPQSTCRFYFEFEHCTITVSKHVFGKLSNGKEEGQRLYMGHQKINHSFTYKLLSNFSRNLLWSAISLHWFLIGGLPSLEFMG